MTQGGITRHLVKYSVPLIVGNLFQLAYNAVDAIIAGRFIGKEALAAEGMAAPVMNLIILGISGICMGAGVLMSEFFGAKNHEMIKREMATVALFGGFFSAAVALLGILCTPILLGILHVPDELMKMTVVYLRIIFLGAPFTFFYNALASSLKSVGDSSTPLKFLMFSSLLNAVLDLIFIGLLGFGIVCSAVTTVIAEAVSALLSFVYILKKIPLLHPGKDQFKIDRHLLGKTLRYGGVTALQQSCQPIGKLLIQGTINSLGVDMIAAFNAVSRIDDFAFTPQQSISHGITTFIAQNRGAGRTERVRKGLRTGLAMEALYWLFICLAVLAGRGPLMSLFVTGESAGQIVEIGSKYLGTMAFFYLLPAFTNGIQGFFRGMGKMGMTLLGTFIQTSIRVIGTWILAPILGIYGVAFACAAGWTAMLLVEVPVMIRTKRSAGLS